MYGYFRWCAVWIGLGLGLGCGVGAASAAASYPSQPITLVVPFAAGGPADALARVVSRGLTERLGATVVVDNRPGAGGNIGTAAVAKAPADGYTLLLGYIGPLAINPALMGELSYRPLHDFAPVAYLAGNPLVLVARPGLPTPDFAAFAQLAKTTPGGLSYGSGGVGSANHMAGVLLADAAQLPLVHVPYKGAAPATVALLGDQVDVMLNGVSVALPHVTSGKLKALAVTTADRVAALPDVPTLTELGLGPLDVAAWFGVLAPAGTAPDRLATLETAVLATLQQPAVQNQLTTAGFLTRPLGQTAFTQFLTTELATWTDIVQRSGAKPD